MKFAENPAAKGSSSTATSSTTTAHAAATTAAATNAAATAATTTAARIDKLSPRETMFCGGLSGIASRMVIAPLDVIKIRFQMQFNHRMFSPTKPKYSSIWQSLKLIVAEEGITGLWKGNTSALLLYVSYGAVQFSSYQQTKNFLGAYLDSKQLEDSLKSFISGAVAGTSATVLTYPFDVLRTRFSIQNEPKIYNSLLDATRKIYRQEGIRGLYGGMPVTVAQIIPSMGFTYVSYDQLTAMARRLRKTSRLYDQAVPVDMERLTIGGLSGIISKTLVMPADVTRKRLQVQANENCYIIGKIPAYRGALDCMSQIFRREGITGFYKGLTPALLKTAPSSAVTFLVFEKSKEIILGLKNA